MNARDAFTAEQYNELDEHLRQEIPLADLPSAIFAIAMVFLAAQIEIAHKSDLADGRVARRRHMASVHKHATELQRLLAIGRPLVGTQRIRWDRFDAELRDAVVAAEVESAAADERPARRGRRPEAWRDDLVSVVYSVYPAGAAKRSVGSHFEATIDLLLNYLGKPVSDVHSVVLDALVRCPAPPFQVS